MKTPFTIEQFFEVFQNYNSSVFPFQLIFIIIGIVSVFLIHGKKDITSKLITGFLGFLWLWIGIVYHVVFFTSINKAAYGFGGLFIIQGVLMIIELFKNRLEFEFKGSVIQYFGYFFIVFGLFIYPIISYFLEGSFEKTISLGLPCPTTIFTFGFFMLTKARFPKYLLIIPTLWAIIGTGAAINFEVYQDYVMLISAIIANIYLIKRKKEK
jgi:hypothetical protein